MPRLLTAASYVTVLGNDLMPLLEMSSWRLKYLLDRQNLRRSLNAVELVSQWEIPVSASRLGLTIQISKGEDSH